VGSPDASRRGVRKTASIGALVVVLLIAGCGGGDGGSEAIDLTKRLAPGGDFYAVVDVATLKQDLGLPEDADPLDITAESDPVAELVSPALSPLAGLVDPEIAEALDLGAVDAAAASSIGSDGVTVISTTADTGEVGSALGDLGFEDRGGILEGDGEGAPTFRLEEGFILVAADPSLLRDLPAEPADELPAPMLGELDGSGIFISTRPSACTTGFGMGSDADGSGEVGFLVEGGADAARLELDEDAGISFGVPEVDGALITVAVDSDDGSAAAPAAAALLLVNYDC